MGVPMSFGVKRSERRVDLRMSFGSTRDPDTIVEQTRPAKRWEAPRLPPGKAAYKCHRPLNWRQAPAAARAPIKTNAGGENTSFQSAPLSRYDISRSGYDRPPRFSTLTVLGARATKFKR